jgi:hypothetical protein
MTRKKEKKKKKKKKKSQRPPKKEHIDSDKGNENGRAEAFEKKKNPRTSDHAGNGG